jgi:hypothetical protein
MVDYLDRTFRERGQIDANTLWFPGCSFRPDTAAGLTQILQLSPGLYHLDGNPGLNFLEIAMGFNRLWGNPWKVFPVSSLVQNHRMLDPRVSVVRSRAASPPNARHQICTCMPSSTTRLAGIWK